ncbi:hypothetical protein [Pseudoxanthomonas sp. UTMC 1351]|uniref:hypothetical protein n=1 Tax=Pseudoxanthomonas sp. UTMC 1351 TaxID=2695853 RepID=UPI0034CE5492
MLLLLAMCLPSLALTTTIAPTPLEEKVRKADHVVVAKVASVDMVDGQGQPVTDRAARTGPGLTNQIWLNLEVQEVLFAQTKPPPRTLRVPLWRMWHHELGMMQDYVTGTTRIFLLKGDAYEPVLPADFQAGLEDRAEVVRLLETGP